MKRLAIPVLVSLLALAIGAGLTRLNSAPSTAHAAQLGIDDELTPVQERLVSGFASFTLGHNADNNAQGDDRSPRTYFPRGSDACPNNQSSNIKVNQNCLNLSDLNLQGRGRPRTRSPSRSTRT